MNAALRSRARQFARALAIPSHDHALNGELWEDDPLGLLFKSTTPALDHKHDIGRVPVRGALLFGTLNVPTGDDPPDWVAWHAHNFYLPEIIETTWGDPVCCN